MNQKTDFSLFISFTAIRLRYLRERNDTEKRFQGKFMNALYFNLLASESVEPVNA